MIRLYTAAVCPFAQRVRAVLARLDLPYEPIEVDLDHRDPRFLAQTPTGRVPLFFDGDLKLYESQIICEYLAERHGWHEAFPAEPGLRARVKLAMKQWDQVIIAVWYRSLHRPEGFDQEAAATLRRELDELEATLEGLGEHTDNLLGVHCAPFWVRMEWLAEYAPATAAIAGRDRVRCWLEQAARMRHIQLTSPERDEAVRRYLAFRGR